MENKNYVALYYKSQEHDLTKLINTDMSTETKINNIKKEINKLQKEIEEKGLELHQELDKFYKGNFTPISAKNVIRYNGKAYTVHFDLLTGLPLETEEEQNIQCYSIDSKKENVSVVVGYSYELASIITKTYEVRVARDNSKITIKLLGETVISFMDTKAVYLDVETNNVVEDEVKYTDLYPLRQIFDNEFINNFYGVDLKINRSLYDLRANNLGNKSFEIIIKTAPIEIMEKLLDMNVDQSLPVYKIIGISQETYNTAIERGTIKTVFLNRAYINGTYNEKFGINKTEKEWLDLIDELEHYDEDLQFYNIRYGSYYGNYTLLDMLLRNYTEIQAFREYYSLGKFINYVINETINQGYSSVNDFIQELSDYLRMCYTDNIKPTLYSSYLKQTHDITSRNHKVKVEKEQEEMFQSRYKDFKPYKSKEYSVIAPKTSTDLKKEGDALNHCVASYIKRVIDGECLILFLRKDVEESLVTLEIRHNTIVQVRGLHNRKPTKNETESLQAFAKARGLSCNF